MNAIRNVSSRPLLLALALALAGTAGYAAYAHWQNERQSVKQGREITELNERWQETTNAVTAAKSAEHEQTLEGFLKPEQVRWKLFYDRGKQRNFLEVRVRNPLQFHRASFGVNFQGQTEAWKNDGREAEPRFVSLDLVVRDLKPGEGHVSYVPFPAQVPTRAQGRLGKMLDCFRWNGLPTVEAPIDDKTVQVRVYADQAALMEEAPAQVEQVPGK